MGFWKLFFLVSLFPSCLCPWFFSPCNSCHQYLRCLGNSSFALHAWGHCQHYYYSLFKNITFMIFVYNNICFPFLQRDIVGIGGSWSDFADYFLTSLKSQDLKLVLEPDSNSDGTYFYSLLLSFQNFKIENIIRYTLDYYQVYCLSWNNWVTWYNFLGFDIF